MSGHLQPCESRAFFVVDALSPGCLIWTRKALLQLGNTLSLCLKAPPPLGLAIMKRMAMKQSSQCNILLRPGTTFQLKEYTTILKRVTAASPEDAADGNMLAGAITALLQHMMKLPGGEACHNHIFVLSSTLSASPKLQQIMQYARQSKTSLHFLQLAGPEADISHDTADADQTDQNNTKQQHPIDPAIKTAEFEQLVVPFAPHATFDNFTADCGEVSDLLCQCWLRELMTHSTSKDLAAPDLILQLGQQQLPCNLQQHILQLEPWLLPAHLCPCHHQPMQPPTGSAAALQAAAAAGTDPASAAGLLLLPEEVPWRCSISGNLVLQALTGCRTDQAVVQLSRHTQLKIAAGAAAGLAGTAGQGCCNLPAALVLPAGQPCNLEVKHVVGLNRIDSMMLYGMPIIVSPAACNSLNSNPSTAAATAEDSSMFMRAVCQLLLEKHQVLLASAHHDLVRRCQQPLKQWYMLQPAADGCSLLLRYMASKEQLLPPRGFRGIVGLESEVVLLDADQLEAARTSLAGLELPGAVPRAVGEQLQEQLHVSVQDTSADGTGVPGQDPLVAEAASAAEAADKAEGRTADSVRDCAGLAHDDDDDGGPLLLSCGLHEWMQTVLDSSTATYQAPPAPPTAAAPPGQQQGQQQQQQHQAMQYVAGAASAMGAGPQPTSAAAVLAQAAPMPAGAAGSWQTASTHHHPQQHMQQHWQGHGHTAHPQQGLQGHAAGGHQQLPAGVTTRRGAAAAGSNHGVTTAAQMLQGLQAGQQGPGNSAVPGGPSGRAQRRGTGRNALRLSGTGAGGNRN